MRIPIFPLVIIFVVFFTQGCINKATRKKPVHGSFFNIDTTIRTLDIPLYTGAHQWKGSAWRGERISCQLIVWAPERIENVDISIPDLSGQDNAIISSEHIKPFKIEYVMTDEYGDGCSKKGILNYDSSLVADVLDPIQAPFNLETRIPQLVWISVDIPQTAEPGTYKGSIELLGNQKRLLDLKMEIEVLSPELPVPSQWMFHLDLWQNPFAVARYFKVDLWSDKHFELMKPTFEMLANAGQKCITTTITDKPWAGQTFDPFESMVKKTRKLDGSWMYDYSVFDSWVEFVIECGIDDQINCYSMVSWSNTYTYFDAALKKDISVLCNPGTIAYNQLWSPFLNDFNKHLIVKGWKDITAISMDERSFEELTEVIKLVDKEAPGLKIALAGGYHPELNEELYDLSVASRYIVPVENLSQRRNAGFKTTFYVCCVEEQPNTFTFSNPADATYLAWYAANRQFDGMLRWSYNSWPLDPLKDSRFRSFPAGDVFIVYPGGKSSVRFERLREGIQDYEKIRILRSGFEQEQTEEAKAKLKVLIDHLKKFDVVSLDTIPSSTIVARGKELLYQYSR